MQKGSKVFTTMVVGDNPIELMSKYDMSLEVEPYVKYKYLDAEKMKNNSIKIFNEIVKNPKSFNINEYQTDVLNERLVQLKKMTPFEYYSELTKGLFIDDNGNALSTENPNGKWQTSKIGEFFSIPLILNDGTTTHSALNKDINWDKLHMNNTYTYEIVWQLIKEGKKPSSEEEETLFNNMKDNVNYFANFKNVDEYVIHNCAYWNYAYLDKDGWQDMDDDKDYSSWISTFFDKFVTKLNPNDKITIFECTKGKID